jgi:RecJ-like exonuclease
VNDNEERPEIPCPFCHGVGAITTTEDERLRCDLCDGEGWLS